jgi:hypothetical protein
MGLQRFPMSGFHGGWNLRDAPQTLEPNEAQDLLNVTLADVIGALEERSGKTRFDTGLAGVADNIRPWYPNDATKYLAASIGGSIYFISSIGVPTLKFAGTAGTVWSFEQAEDVAGNPFLWCMNGTDTPKKIDATGVVSDWANSPPNGTVIKLWKNRMAVSGVAATPQRIFLSDIGDPENPALAYDLNWVDIKGTEEDLDPVTNLVVFTDFLYVFKRKSLWAITVSNAPWDNERVASNLGCEGRFQSCVLQTKLYFFNRTGIWSIQSDGRVTEESDPIKPLWTTRVNMTVLDKVRMMVTPQNRVMCALPLDNSATNNYVLELVPNLNFRRVGLSRSVIMPSVCLHDWPIASFCNFRPATTDVILAGDATTGRSTDCSMARTTMARPSRLIGSQGGALLSMRSPSSACGA